MLPNDVSPAPEVPRDALELSGWAPYIELRALTIPPGDDERRQPGPDAPERRDQRLRRAA